MSVFNATVSAADPFGVVEQTPWGPAGAVLLCLLPIGFLLVVTLVKPLMLPSSISLPLAALWMALVKLAYLSAPPLDVASAAAAGLLQGLVPLSVVFGAISLFQSMQHTKCLPFLMLHLKRMSTGDPVAETFLVGWAFAYTLEGIGGFGAPVALGTPMLVALGHDPLMAVVALVILNCLASHLGTVGMMIWFGFGQMQLGDANLVRIAGKAAALMALPAFVVAPVAASFLCPWPRLRRAWPFVLASVASAVAPTVAVAAFNHDIPVVVGGICSFLVTATMVKFRIGFGDAAASGAAGARTSASAERAAALKAAVAEAVANGALPKPSGGGGGAAVPATADNDDVRSPFAAAVPVAGAGDVEAGGLGRRGSLGSNDDGAAFAPCVAAITPSGASSWVALVVGRGSSFDAHRQPRARSATFARNGGDATQQHPRQDAADAVRKVQSSDVYAYSSRGGQGGRAHARWSGACSAAGSEAGSRPSRRRVRPMESIDTCGMVPVPAALVSCSRRGSRAAGDGGAAAAAEVDCIAAAAADPLPGADTAANEAAAAAAGAAAAAAAGPAVLGLPPLTAREVALRTLPLTFTVLLLLVTRAPQLGLVNILRSTSPSVTARLGTLGDLSISAALVVRLDNILTCSQGFAYEALFVPCLLPFVAASALTLLVFWRDLDPACGGTGSGSGNESGRRCGGGGGFCGRCRRRGRRCCGGRWAAARQLFAEAWRRSEGAAAALMGALAFAQLMRTGGGSAPAAIIGFYASRSLRRGAVVISGLLGAVSSFVGGNVVAGNLTFGTIQAAAAWAAGVPVTSALAMQDVGACAGKMVCLANIVSARAVVNLGGVPEGAIIRHTLPSALILLAMSTATSLLLLLPLPGSGFFLPDLPMPFGHPVF